MHLTGEGIVFRLDPDLSLHKVIHNVAIPNGTAWSSDDKTMYFTDSPTTDTAVVAYDFDAETGAMSNKRVFFSVKDYYGDKYTGQVPDGCAIDVEDHLWIAIHEGGEVLRVNPQGKVVGRVELPAWKITCPVFGGENMDELFITCAGLGEGEKSPEKYKHNGAIFRVKVGIKGRAKNKFRLEKDV